MLLKEALDLYVSTNPRIQSEGTVSMYHPMRRLLCDAGLPSGRDRLFHCLRRYHATQVALAGGNAQRSLDHSDGRITERYIDKKQLGPEPMPQRPKSRRGLLGWLGLTG